MHVEFLFEGCILNLELGLVFGCVGGGDPKEVNFCKKTKGDIPHKYMVFETGCPSENTGKRGGKETK